MNKLKNILMGTAVLLIFGASSFPAEARVVRVKSYYKPSKNTYIMPSYRTSPNRTRMDNYSTKGNYNPYTGKMGTKKLYKY